MKTKRNGFAAFTLAIVLGTVAAAVGQFMPDGGPSDTSQPATAAVLGQFDRPAPLPEGLPAKLSFPHIGIDAARRQVWLEAEALATNGPLEFFCCRLGTNEYEAAFHSPAKASDLHTALLVLGLLPGTPVHFDEASKQMIPPVGQPLDLSLAYVDHNGKTLRLPAYAVLRNLRTKKLMPRQRWAFVGSRVLDDGTYAADATGYLISVVNFDLTTIDVPELASSANETLEWEINPATMPAAGTRVWIVLTPAAPVPTTAVGQPH